MAMIIKATTIITLFLAFNVCSQEYRDELKEKIAQENNPKEYLHELSSSEKSAKKLAVISNQLGLIYQKENQLDSAAIFHRRALNFALTVNSNNPEIGVSYNKIGIIHYYKGELDSAIINFKKSIPFFDKKETRANAMNNLALMYKANVEPDKAIENYLAAFDIYKDLKDTLKQVVILNNIGALYTDLEEYKQASKYINKALNLSTRIPKQLNISKSNLAIVFVNTKRYEEAIPILNETISYFEENNDIRTLIVLKNNLANCYDELGNSEKGLSIYLDVIEMMNATGNSTNKEVILFNIADSYLNLQKYDLSFNYYHQALSQCRNNASTLNLEEIYRGLATLHQKTNNSDSSLYYKDLQLALRDSLEQVEKEKKMMELESKHQNKELHSDLESTKDELSASEKEKELFSKGLLYSLLIVVVTFLFVIVFYNRYKKKKLLADQLAIENHINEKNIDALESTLGAKEEHIEKLSQQKEKIKKAYPANLSPLTSREKEVLSGVKEGLKDKEIAEKLFLSTATVRTHLRKAYVKIDVRNRAEAIQFITEFEI